MPFGVVGLFGMTHSTFQGRLRWRWWRRWRFREYFRRFLRRRLCFGRHGAKRCRLACFRRNYSRASGIRRRKGDQYQHHAECSSCSGSGAASGSGKIMCSTCGGVGQVASNQGFISIRRTCPTCAGSGIMIENPCAECKGEGRKRSPTKIKVNVPKGVGDGNRLCSRGRGDAGPRGGPSGDLYVDVRIKSHEFLVRDEDDLFHEMMIPLPLLPLAEWFRFQL